MCPSRSRGRQLLLLLLLRLGHAWSGSFSLFLSHAGRSETRSHAGEKRKKR